jgi:carbon storage regulator
MTVTLKQERGNAALQCAKCEPQGFFHSATAKEDGQVYALDEHQATDPPNANKGEKEVRMLVLTRKPGEAILIGDNIYLKLVAVRGDAVRLGITAPKDVIVDRQETHEKRKQSPNGDDDREPDQLLG